jgi:hypothetical protein
MAKCLTADVNEKQTLKSLNKYMWKCMRYLFICAFNTCGASFHTTSYHTGYQHVNNFNRLSTTKPGIKEHMLGIYDRV